MKKRKKKPRLAVEQVVFSETHDAGSVFFSLANKEEYSVSVLDVYVVHPNILVPAPGAPWDSVPRFVPRAHLGSTTLSGKPPRVRVFDRESSFPLSGNSVTSFVFEIRAPDLGDTPGIKNAYLYALLTEGRVIVEYLGADADGIEALAADLSGANDQWTDRLPLED